MKTNLERLQMVIIDRYCIEAQEINENSNLEEDLGMDSLDVVEFTMELEKEFDIVISDTEMEEWVTVQDVLNTLEKHTN